MLTCIFLWVAWQWKLTESNVETHLTNCSFFKSTRSGYNSNDTNSPITVCPKAIQPLKLRAIAPMVNAQRKGLEHETIILSPLPVCQNRRFISWIGNGKQNESAPVSVMQKLKPMQCDAVMQNTICSLNLLFCLALWLFVCSAWCRNSWVWASSFGCTFSRPTVDLGTGEWRKDPRWVEGFKEA